MNAKIEAELKSLEKRRRAAWKRIKKAAAELMTGISEADEVVQRGFDEISEIVKKATFLRAMAEGKERKELM